MSVLGVQRVGGDDRAGRVDAVQQVPESGGLVALVGGLALGQDVTGVVHRGEQGDAPGDVGARAAQGLAVNRDRPQSGAGRGGAGGEEAPIARSRASPSSWTSKRRGTVRRAGWRGSREPGRRTQGPRRSIP
ncbi:hypothetical protein GCM10010254_76110 [Streptomyces chromofuscus]|nr:hypothetical protein GCM10010254_76110 [Streptomyces chromofuscus]